MTHQDNNKPNPFLDFFAKNAWALILVVSSVVAQWAVFGVRLDNLEQGVDTNTLAISETRTQLAETQNQYAALEAKLEGIDANVTYIRTRLDAVLRNGQ